MDAHPPAHDHHHAAHQHAPTRPRAVALRPRPSLLLLSAPERLGVAAALTAGLWLLVAWAVQS